MKKRFLKKAFAAILSTAMIISVVPQTNLATVSAAKKNVGLNTTFKTLKVGKSYKLKLKNNSINWKIQKVSTSNKKICTVYKKKSTSVLLKGKNEGRATIKIKVKTNKRKILNTKTLKCRVKVVPKNSTSIPEPQPSPNPIKTYDIAFNTNGGSYISGQTVESGKTIVKPNDPTRQGYIFKGWYSDVNLENVYDFSSAVTENITLYAKWNNTYTVKFQTNGGNTIEDQIIENGEKVTKPNDPTRSRSTFVGWFSDSQLKEKYDFSSTVTKDMTIYARWQVENDYQPNWGYTGDNTTGNNSGNNNATPTKYTVKFDSNGGSEIEDQIIVDGNNAIKPKDPIKEGYIFDGWYMDQELKIIYKFDSKITTNIILYAKWKHDENSVSALKDEIQEMINVARLNDGQIPYNDIDDNGVLNFIEGKYSDKKVNSIADAIESLNDIHNIMKFDNAQEEFMGVYSENVNLGNATNYYRLQQIYKNIPVYGYQMTVSTNADGEIQTLSGHYYPEININIEPQISDDEARKNIENSNCTSDGLCIYIDDNTPVLCWKMIDSYATYFIDAKTGEITATISNVIDESITGKGANLENNEVSFPVEKTSDKYYLYDNLRNIRIADSNHQNNQGTPINEETNDNWSSHREAITVYTNMLKIFDYYANVLGRDSASNSHRETYINVNHRPDPSTEFSNAFFDSDVQGVTYIAIGDGNNYPGALDVLAHEFTHAVTDSIWTGIYDGESGALNEAYSDIIGDLFEDKELYLHGEDLTLGANRNFKDPSKPQNNNSVSQPSHYNDRYKGEDDHHGVHINSGIINHAAYLMDQNWPESNHSDELAALFYKSMFYLSPNSNFLDCRHALLAASKSMNMSTEKRNIIATALSDVGVKKSDEEVWLSMHHIIGNIKDANDNSPVIDAEIIAIATSGLGAGIAYSDGIGNYDMKLNRAKYTVYIFADGYNSYTIEEVDLSSWFEMNKYMETIYLTPANWADSTQNIFAQGNITNAITGEAIEGATVKFRKNSENQNGEYVQIVSGMDIELITDNDGQYYTAALPAGNYTLEVFKDGFVTGYKNIISGNSDSCKNQNLSLTPILKDNEMRVVLTWGKNPRDLDSHMVGTLTSGNLFHVYYGHKFQYDNNSEICNLDVDDTSSYGPETITLNMEGSQPYYYYIHHYGGKESISTSNAQIKIYRGSENVVILNAPTDQGTDKYWNAFAIINGELIVNNTITSSPNITYAGTNATSSDETNSDSKQKVLTEDIDEFINEELINNEEKEADE